MVILTILSKANTLWHRRKVETCVKAKSGGILKAVNEIKATEGAEKARSHKGDMKSLRQARRKTKRLRRGIKGSSKQKI